MSRPNPLGKFHTEPIAKLLIIGDSGVGKTSIVTQFIDSFFTMKTSSTIMIDFKLKKVKIDDAEFKLQIWDTAGQEKYKAITRNFYTNSMAAMIVFDLTSSESFENVRNWVRHANSQAQGDTCKILVGNKSDMVNERIVSKEEIDEMAAELGVEAIEVSAKSGEGINEAFMMISRDIKNKFFSELKSQAPLESILLKKEDDKEKLTKRGCC